MWWLFWVTAAGWNFVLSIVGLTGHAQFMPRVVWAAVGLAGIYYGSLVWDPCTHTGLIPVFAGLKVIAAIILVLALPSSIFWRTIAAGDTIFAAIFIQYYLKVPC